MFDDFDDIFDGAEKGMFKMFAKWGAIAVVLNLVFYAILVALIVGGILILKAHGVF